MLRRHSPVGNFELVGLHVRASGATAKEREGCLVRLVLRQLPHAKRYLERNVRQRFLPAVCLLLLLPVQQLVVQELEVSLLDFFDDVVLHFGRNGARGVGH